LFYVNHAAFGANNGLTWENAFVDLQNALQVAQAGDEIWVAEGTYFPTTTTDRTISFEPVSGTRLYGGFTGTETDLGQRDWAAHPAILNGDIGITGDSTDNSVNVLYLFQPDSNTVVDGFQIWHGVADNVNAAGDTRDREVCGGGLYINAGNWDAFATIRNCRFWHNTAIYNGGGAMLYGTSSASVAPRFVNCVFEDNHALVLGGGLARFGGSWAERGTDFSGCVFSHNSAKLRGGGLYYSDSQGPNTISLHNCTFEKNTALTSGGGAFFLTGKPGKSGLYILNTIFKSNIAPQGAALNVFTNGNVFDGEAVIDSCLFEKNISILGSGGDPSIIYADQFGTPGTLVKLTNSCIKENISDRHIVLISWYDANAEVSNNKINQNEALNLLSFDLLNSNEISRTVFSSNECINIVGHSFSSIDATLNFSNCLLEKNKLNYIFRLAAEAQNVNMFINNTDFLKEEVPHEFINWSIYTLNFANNILTDSTPTSYFLANLDSPTFLSHNSFRSFDCNNQNPLVTCGPNNLFGLNPMFRDTANGDYTLLPCSPLINAGSNVAAAGILTDITGTPRIQGGTVDIGAYEAPSFALATTPTILPACTGAPGGAITISPTNGCQPYTYQWLPSAGNGPEITDLPPGDYSYTVTDARGRKLSDTLNITTAQPPELSPLTHNIQCGSPLGGSATVSVSNGSAPYSFLWENAATDSLRAMLPAGNYQVTVTDHNGCHNSTQMTITKQGNITLMVDGEAISCFGASDAMISAAPVNGKAPFQYLWSPTGSNDSLLTDLGPGMYTVTATDFYGCTATFTFTLSDPGLLQASILTMPASSIQSPNGIATANVSGGTAPHTYAWSNSGSTMTIGGLPPAIYTVTVTDANGCSTTATAQVKLVSSSTEIADLTVQVWPNPMRERLELQVPGLPTGTYRFVLRDALGRALAGGGVDVLGGRAVLDVRDLVPGAYSWSLEGRNGVLARGKVVK